MYREFKKQSFITYSQKKAYYPAFNWRGANVYKINPIHFGRTVR